MARPERRYTGFRYFLRNPPPRMPCAGCGNGAQHILEIVLVRTPDHYRVRCRKCGHQAQGSDHYDPQVDFPGDQLMIQQAVERWNVEAREKGMEWLGRDRGGRAAIAAGPPATRHARRGQRR